MADVVSPEVQVRAIVKESGAPLAPIQPIVDSLRKALDNNSAEAALRLAANRDVDKAKINFAINEKIGINRNADGTKNIIAATPEAARKTRADNAGRIAGDLIEKGYDRLVPADQLTARTAVLNLIDTYPAFQAVMTGPPAMTPLQKDQFAMRILKDPAYKEQITNGLRNLVDVTGVNTDSVTQLQKEFDAAHAEVDRIDTELHEINLKIGTLNRRLGEYKPEVVDMIRVPAVPHIREGDSFYAINSLNGEIVMHNTGVRTRTIDLTRMRGELNGHKDRLRMAMASRGGLTPADVAGINTDITGVETGITTTSLEIEDLNRQIAEKTAKRDAITAQEGELKRQLAEEQTKRAALVTERNGPAKTEAEKQMALAKAKADQTFKEEEFVKGLENALADAAAAHINRQVEITATEGVTILDKQAAEAKDKREKVVLDDFRERYFNNSKVDRDEIREDFNELMSNGPDNIIRNSLVASGMTAAEVTEAMNDTEYMDKMRKDVGKKVMGFHLLRGGFLGRNGRISADESLMIKNSPWGEQIINDALKGNKDWQDELKKQMGSGIISGGGRLSENLRNMSTGRLISLLLLIFGGGLAALTFGPAAIGAAGGAVATIMPK